MLASAELGHKVTKAAFEKEEPKLRLGLLTCLQDLKTAPFPVLVVLSGDDARGCNLALNRLHGWMDTRYLEAYAFGRAEPEEEERPFLWRYWNSLPRRGKIGIYVRGWTKGLLSLRLRGKLGRRAFDARVQQSIRFEEQLLADGALLRKFWVHLPPTEVERRRAEGKREREDRWGLTKTALESYTLFEKGRDLVEETLRWTSRGDAVWHAVEGTDDRHRDLVIGSALLKALTDRIAAPAPPDGAGDPIRLATDPETVLDRVDLSAKASAESYEKLMRRRQTELHRWSRILRNKQRSAVLVFEGWDAAGKGGAIRRLTAAMDAVYYRVHNIAAPTQDELAHPYLWRFWRRLPRAGHVAIFDRSWYGRVLVERVEGFASPAEWRRAYAEINDFEEQIRDAGSVLLKFWLHIDRDEQLRRFEARSATAFKRYKITEEDYRNRERWSDYEAAAADMLSLTDSEEAPWILVPGNDKKYARLEVLRRLNEALRTALD